MKFQNLFILMMLSFAVKQIAYAQTKTYLLSGTVKDHEGQPLPGVTLMIATNGVAGKNLYSSSSGTTGGFSFHVPEGSYTISCSYIGFRTSRKTITITGDQRLSIQLEADGNEMQEVKIRSTRKTNTVKNLETGVQSINIETLRKSPAIFGEVDVVRSIMTLPGVSSVGEGSSGFNVRGGNVDQNLILMDGAPLFNTSHLFGLFSAFNPDAVEDVKLIKGGMPANYGGRLSSVLDVKLKSGNPDSLTISGGLGTVSARLAAAFPVAKGKGSVFLSGRRTFADLFLKLSSDEDTKNTVAYFQDFNGKAEYKLGAKDHLYLSGYYGYDKLGLQKDFTTSYSNANAAITHKHEFSPVLNAKTSLLYSRYQNSILVPENPTSFEYAEYIRQFQVKTDWNYQHSKVLNLNAGVSAIRYNVNPGIQTPVGDSSLFNITASAKQLAYEYGAYVENSQEINEKLSVQYGLRLSAYEFRAADDGSVYQYGGTPGQELSPISSTNYLKGKPIKRYMNLEPRASLRYLLSEQTSLKASYNRMSQYVHMITATNASTPFDPWLASTNNIKPEVANQFSLGYFRSNADYEASLEGYYKQLSNQIDVINGTEPIGNPDIEKDLVYGKGRSMGLEFYLKKKSGKLNGWVSYTLSRTQYQIDGINENNWYNAKYDRTHNLDFVAVYNHNKRWSFAGNFVYQTGIAATFPSGRTEFQGLILPYNNGNLRNNYRYKAYTRLDLSATLYTRHAPGSKFSSNWVFSLYNVGNRQNVYAQYFRQDPADPTKTMVKQLSIIGSIVPGVTWNFNF
jgi:hypothetical protein